MKYLFLILQALVQAKFQAISPFLAIFSLLLLILAKIFQGKPLPRLTLLRNACMITYVFEVASIDLALSGRIHGSSDIFHQKTWKYLNAIKWKRISSEFQVIRASLDKGNARKITLFQKHFFRRHLKFGIKEHMVYIFRVSKT